MIIYEDPEEEEFWFVSWRNKEPLWSSGRVLIAITGRGLVILGNRAQQESLYKCVGVSLEFAEQAVHFSHSFCIQLQFRFHQPQ